MQHGIPTSPSVREQPLQADEILGNNTSTVTLTGPAQEISVTMNSGGATYTPAPGFVGNDTLTVTSNDNGNGAPWVLQDREIVAIKVNGAPTTGHDTVIANFGAAALIDIPEWAFTHNDVDPNGDVVDVAEAADGAAAPALTSPDDTLLPLLNGGSPGSIRFTDNGTLGGSFTYRPVDRGNTFAPGTDLLGLTTATVTINNFTTSTSTLTGTAGVSNIIFSANNSDTLIGRELADVLIGNGGNDTLRGGAGNDRLDGGINTDILDLSDATAGITITLSQGSALVSVDLSSGGLGVDQYQNMEGVIGSGFADTINGSSSVDTIIGGGGNDTLSGLGGVDTITGGTGDDILAGGTGNDIYKFGVADGADTINDLTDQDNIEITGAVTSLNFARSGNDLVMTFNGTQITHASNYSGNSAAEDLFFAAGGTVFGGYVLPAGAATGGAPLLDQHRPDRRDRPRGHHRHEQR